MNEHVIAIQISQAILQITVGYITDIFVMGAHLWSFFPCSCCTDDSSWISDMIASVMIFAEPHADGALAFGIKDQLTTLTRYHI